MQLTAEQTSLEPLPYRGEQGGPRAVHERARLVNARESQIPELPQSIETTCRIEMSPAGRPVVSLRAPDPPVLALMPRQPVSEATCCARTMLRLVLIPGHGLWGCGGKR